MKKLMAVLLALCLIIGMMPMMALADGGADGSDNMQQTYDLHDKEGDVGEGVTDLPSDDGSEVTTDPPKPSEPTEPTGEPVEQIEPEKSSSPTNLDALKTAIENAVVEDTIELGADITGPLTISGKSFTLDGMNKTFNGDITVKDGSSVVFRNLKINGTLTVIGSSVVIEDCTISDANAAIVIKSSGMSFLPNVVSIANTNLYSEVLVKDETGRAIVSNDMDLVGYTKDGVVYYTDNEYVPEEPETPVKPEKVVAVIGDETYESLAEALEEAEYGDTIRLLDDNKLTTSANLDRGVTLVVTGGATLTIPSSVTFTNNGRIENYGTVEGYTANRPVLTSLSFTVAPGSADIELYRYWRGELDPVNREGNSYLVPNGDYRYVISASGYETEYGDVTVSGSERIILVQLDENDTHRVYVEPTVNGDLSVDEVWAEEGEWVYITVKPDAGYRLDELTVTRPSGNEVKVYHVRDNVFRFKMPGVRVTVDAEFVRSSLPFSDVSRGQWFYDYVAWAYNTGLMEGVSAGRFAPNSTTTRAMVITIIYRLAGSPGVSGTSDFTDVPADAWYSDAVTWAAKRGIVEGMTATTFDPNDAVTREELAAMLYRYAKHKGYDTSAAENTNILSYNDALSISEYAFEALQWACGEGIINGTGAGSLEPGGSATRAQLAAMLYRFCAEYVY